MSVKLTNTNGITVDISMTRSKLVVFYLSEYHAGMLFSLAGFFISDDVPNLVFHFAFEFDNDC